MTRPTFLLLASIWGVTLVAVGWASGQKGWDRGICQVQHFTVTDSYGHKWFISMRGEIAKHGPFCAKDRP